MNPQHPQWNEFRKALSAGKIELIQKLIEDGVDPSVEHNKGNTSIIDF